MPRYFIITFLIFWVPSFILLPLVLPRIDKNMRKAFWLSLLLFAWPLSFMMEYVYLWADVWDFTEAWDPLLGWRIMGAPVEEFVFWFGAPLVLNLVYLALDLLDKKYFRKKPHA